MPVALTFAQLSRNKALTRKLVARFEPLFGVEAHLIPTADHVDPSVFGAVPLELNIQTRDARYLTVAEPRYDAGEIAHVARAARGHVEQLGIVGLEIESDLASSRRELTSVSATVRRAPALLPGGQTRRPTRT